jgi:hypothetical protein
MQSTVGTGPPDAAHARDQVPEPPPRPNFSMKPALIVGALAVVILVIFSLGAAMTHTPLTPAKAPTGSVAVKGSSLRAVSAQKQLSVIESDGQPPANVLAATTLPVGAVRGVATNLGQGSTYDQQVDFTIDASEQAVLSFYKTEMGDLGWRTVTSGAATHQAGRQIVGQIAGEDGFYWQLGVVVSPSTFTNGGTTDVTGFELRLLQVGDEGS